MQGAAAGLRMPRRASLPVSSGACRQPARSRLVSRARSRATCATCAPAAAAPRCESCPGWPRAAASAAAPPRRRFQGWTLRAQRRERAAAQRTPSTRRQRTRACVCACTHRARRSPSWPGTAQRAAFGTRRLLPSAATPGPGRPGSRAASHAPDWPKPPRAGSLGRTKASAFSAAVCARAPDACSAFCAAWRRLRAPCGVFRTQLRDGGAF